MTIIMTCCSNNIHYLVKYVVQTFPKKLHLNYAGFSWYCFTKISNRFTLSTFLIATFFFFYFFLTLLAIGFLELNLQFGRVHGTRKFDNAQVNNIQMPRCINIVIYFSWNQQTIPV